VYNEKKFQADFAKHLREKQKESPHPDQSYWNQTMVLEYKTLQAPKRLNWKQHLQPQQLPSLHKAKHRCLYKKLSDIDPAQKPMDAFQICNAPAFLTICWFEPRLRKTVYMIDVDIILKEIKQNPKTKSLTEQRAREIATHIFQL